jgi:hypothetical protein
MLDGLAEQVGQAKAQVQRAHPLEPDGALRLAPARGPGGE